MPAQWYGIEAGYPVEAPLEATTYGIGDGYVPGDAMYEEPLGPGPATGAYIAVDGAGAASLPASEAGCALVTVLLVGSGSYAAAVVLPTMGATTPMELQEVLRDAHRRGRFVRLRGPGGLGMMIPAGPGIREIEVDTCR